MNPNLYGYRLLKQSNIISIHFFFFFFFNDKIFNLVQDSCSLEAAS